MALPRFVRAGAASVLVLACCACATAPTQTASGEPRSEKMYRTGSHIPVRDPESTQSKTLNTQAVQDQMMQNAGHATTPKGN